MFEALMGFALLLIGMSIGVRLSPPRYIYVYTPKRDSRGRFTKG